MCVDQETDDEPFLRAPQPQKGGRRVGRPCRIQALIDALPDLNVRAGVGNVRPSAAAGAFPGRVGSEEGPPGDVMHDCPHALALRAVPRDAETQLAMFQSVSGYCSTPQLAIVIADRIRTLQCTPDTVDADIVDFALGQVAQSRYVPQGVAAEFAGLDPNTCRSVRHRLAMMCWCWLADERLRGEQLLAESSCKQDLVHFMEWQRYDETPLALRMAEAFQVIVRWSEQELAAVYAIGLPSMPTTLSVQANSSAKKIMQTEQYYGYIIRRWNRLHTFIAEHPQPLQVMESSRAPTLTETLIRNVGTTRYAQGFKSKSRWACGDGHPSNARAESNLKQVRPGWPSVFITCEVHTVVIGLGESVQHTLPDVVRGTLYTALSTLDGEHMSMLRQALYDGVQNFCGEVRTSRTECR